MDYAVTIAAALSLIGQTSSDPIALLSFAKNQRTFLPPLATTEHLQQISGVLQRLQPSGETDFDGALDSLQSKMKKKAIVVVLSDFLDVSPDVFGKLGVLRQRGAEVVVIHTLHRDELDFSFDGVIRFEDMEQDRFIQVSAPSKKGLLRRTTKISNGVSYGCTSATITLFHGSNPSTFCQNSK